MLLAFKFFVQGRPLDQLFGEAMMFLYYGYLFPLTMRIQRGFYEDGVWSDSGFMRWAQISAVSWKEAFDIMADKWKTALKADGPGAVGMFGSGQWTIWEGYAAAKLWMAGFRSNNLDPNARHCMASAVTGLSAARSRASVARSRAENESSNR